MSIREVSAYSLSQAVVRARRSSLLGKQDWPGLVESRDFDSLLTLLSRSPYGPFLQIPSDLLSPRRAAYQIRWRIASDYDKLIDVSPKPGRDVVATLWQSYEVDNLKAAMRGVENRASWDQVRHMLSPMAEHITLTTADLERMVNSDGVARAIDRTAHTPYYETLSHALERYEIEHNLFPLEVALDLDHRRGLWRSVQRLRGTDHREAMRLVGTLLDNENLMWALRYRFYHHLSEQEIVNYTLPFGHKVRDEDIRAIASGEDPWPILLRLYPALADSPTQPELSSGGLTSLEHFLRSRLMRMCREVFRGSPFHIGLAIGYLQLRENEVRNLTTLIEAKASGLALKSFASLMVH